MRKDTANMAKGMIHKISHLLGPKRSALYADECIANLFDSLLDNTQNIQYSFCDKNHFTWIQQHYGLAIIAVEVSTIPVNSF